MSILKLTVKNFLSIKEVEIQPGKVNQIFGQNNQGKTTILKALEFLFKGSTDGAMVHNGQDQAEVIVELDNDMKIHRKLLASGKQAVKVEKGGFKSEAPQALLSTMFDGLTFNPLDVLNPKTRTQFILRAMDMRVTREELGELSKIPAIELPPLDYTKENALVIIDQAHKYFYQRRTEANRTAEDKKKRWETYKADLPAETPLPMAKDAINEDMRSIAEKKADSIAKKLEIDRENKAAEDSRKKIVELDNDLGKIMRDIAVLEEKQRNVLASIDVMHSNIPKELRSTEAFENEIKDYNDSLEKHRLALKDVDVWEAQQKQRKVVDDMKKDFTDAETDAAKIDTRVNSLGLSVKQKIMEKSNLPVEGLSFTDGEFKLNGSSIDNLSSSHALSLAMTIVKKQLSDKTKLICIDGAELLDADMFNILNEEMKKDDFTYFFTKVGDPFEGAEKSFKAESGSISQIH